MGGAQWDRPLNQIKVAHADENPQQISEDDQNTQKTQKDTNNLPENNIQKTPENSQNTPLPEEPINTCGAKYNLRPHPNPHSLTLTDTKKRMKEKFLILSYLFPYSFLRM